MRHPVASRSFVCHHRIGIQNGHSFKFDLAFRQPLVPAVFGHKIRKFERAYRIGFADALPDFSTDILFIQASNTKTFSHLMRGRGGVTSTGVYYSPPFAGAFAGAFVLPFGAVRSAFATGENTPLPAITEHRTNAHMGTKYL